MWIDTHCHPFAGSLQQEEKQAFERARAAGVVGFVVVGFEPSANLNVLRLIEAEDDAVGAVGIHPCDAHLFSKDALALMRKQAVHPKIVALGEMGLDYYHKDTTPEQQELAFRAQIRLANELHLPCIVHSREAAEDTLRILLEEKAERAIFHCYSYDYAFGKQVWEAGYATSFSGVLTYPSARDVQEAAAKGPLEQMLIETDCPWLAPQSVRGQRNEMAYVAEVGKKLAELRGEKVEDIQNTLQRNTDILFAKKV
jgi:TatD DNase family protein